MYKLISHLSHLLKPFLTNFDLNYSLTNGFKPRDFLPVIFIFSKIYVSLHFLRLSPKVVGLLILPRPSGLFLCNVCSSFSCNFENPNKTKPISVMYVPILCYNRDKCLIVVNLKTVFLEYFNYRV